MTKFRSIVSAIALLVVAPAPSAMAQLLDGLNLPGLGGITDGLDGGGLAVPLGGNGDISVGGPNGVVEANATNVDGGGAINDPAGISVGDPNGVDAGIDGGALAAFGVAPGTNSNLTILGGGDPLNNPGAGVPLGILGNNAMLTINRDGQLIGLDFGLGGPDADPDPLPQGPIPVDPNPNGGGPGPNAVNQGQITEAVANLSESSRAQRRAIRNRCQGILADPGQFDDAIVALCAALR